MLIAKRCEDRNGVLRKAGDVAGWAGKSFFF
jgi:hypothetical protein